MGLGRGMMRIRMVLPWDPCIVPLFDRRDVFFISGMQFGAQRHMTMGDETPSS